MESYDRLRLNTYRDALMYFGLSAQLGILQEECAEVIQAVSKFNRKMPKDKIDTRMALIEELADVEIMIDQIKIALACSQIVEDMKDKKIERLRGMLDLVLRPSK